MLVLTCLLKAGNSKQNTFDSLDSIQPPKQEELRDELTWYLASDIEFTTDVIQWWRDRRSDFPSPLKDGFGLFDDSWCVTALYFSWMAAHFFS